MRRPSFIGLSALAAVMSTVTVGFMVGIMVGKVARADEYVPPPPEKVPNYFATLMPCKLVQLDRTLVDCKGNFLQAKTLRELSILRNTIYARYGWSGYRKPWLKAYFAAQPWFKANPKFNYKMLTDVDRKNAHLIGAQEQSLDTTALQWMKDDVAARHGKVWNDVPEWTLKSAKTEKACKPPKEAADTNDIDVSASRDCHYRELKWYKADKSYSDERLTPDDKVELGLIARGMGSFALDETSRDKAADASLDRILPVVDLRQLSLRDLRLLRNTIYARRGRAFKSAVLRDHFLGMSWYKVNDAYDDKLLTKNDSRNITLIKNVENEFGGPLSDEDWLTEPAVDGA